MLCGRCTSENSSQHKIDYSQISSMNIFSKFHQSLQHIKQSKTFSARLNKIATTFFLATFLFFTTAFNSGNAIASPNSYSLPSSNLLAAQNRSETAYPTDDDNLEGVLYSDSDKTESLNSVDDFISPQEQKQLLDPTQIPAKKQPIIDRSNPDNKLLEKTGQMFDDAGDFSAN